MVSRNRDKGCRAKRTQVFFLGFYFHVKVANDLDSSRYVSTVLLSSSVLILQSTKLNLNCITKF